MSHQYATTTQLAQLAIPSNALTGISSDDQNAQLQAASAVADGYLRSHYGVPLVSYDLDLSLRVSQIAAYYLLQRRGFLNENQESNFRKGLEDALAWLRDVSKGLVGLSDVTDGTDSIDEGGPIVLSNDVRGF